jgi:hypothetical protein
VAAQAGQRNRRAVLRGESEIGSLFSNLGHALIPGMGWRNWKNGCERRRKDEANRLSHD